MILILLSVTIISERFEKKKNSTFIEGEVSKKNSFYRVSPINAALDVSIVDSSIKRKGYTYCYVL